MRPAHVASVIALLLDGSCCRAPVVDRVENPASGEKPLDLIAKGPPDDSGLPLAPRWKHQWDGGGVPDAQVLCAGSDGKLALDRCTSQKPVLDVAAGFADAICAFGTSRNIHGHANWWPVTYRGNLYWNEASIDLDYTLSLRPEGEAALATPNGGVLHVEFDSSETVRFFDTPWWNELHTAAARSKAAPHQIVKGQPAVLTGLFGLDCEHKCQAELHPVYLLALQVNDAANDDTWAFFARNWGNEGFCSRYLHVLPIETVTIRIPWRCGATAVKLGTGTVVKKSRGVPSDPRIIWAAGEGVLVEFDLPLPNPRGGDLPRVHGEIHLAWTLGAPCVQASVPPTEPGPPRVQEEGSAEQRLDKFAKPEGKALDVLTESKDDIPSKLGEPTRVERLPPKTFRAASTRIEEAKQKLQRDEKVLSARCEAEREKIGRVPPGCEPLLVR